MDDEKLRDEIVEMKRVIGYLLWSLGAALTIRQPIDLQTEEGRAVGKQALIGFAGLMKIAMEEFPFQKDPAGPPWVM